MCSISKTLNTVKQQKPPCTRKCSISETPKTVKQKPLCTPKCIISKTPNRVKQQEPQSYK